MRSLNCPCVYETKDPCGTRSRWASADSVLKNFFEELQRSVHRAC